MNPYLTLKNISVKSGSDFIIQDISLQINNNEHWAITGPSGSGKTTLAKVIAGNVFHHGMLIFYDPEKPVVMLVEQQHKFKTLSNTNDFYYQQRFNSSDAEDSITAREVLKEFAGNATTAELEYIIELLHLENSLDKPLVQLSNGENKRLQLAEACITKPDLLILDNPFTGLDTEGRKTLHSIINTISATNTKIIIITHPMEIPECITNIAVLNSGNLAGAYKKEDFIFHHTNKKEKAIINKVLLDQMDTTIIENLNSVIKMVNVNVKYGDKVILKNINLEVKSGEHWSISGPNGAGKSTLLSLITADNPQAYANEIYLFDKRRGRGESIWDIKKRIGYVSPEMHIAFDRGSSCFHVVASGLFDTIGLFRQLNEEQEAAVYFWMKLMHIEKLAEKPLFQLSPGQQRMILLVRALVKNPPLLVLDEPCQGLDDEQVLFFNTLVTEICTHFKTTLLYVTHYKEQLADCIDKFLELVNGEKVS